MKGQIRNIYPGGNTPKGFYSYYNYILPRRKAKKIFCIKGGPGTGKSTFMKDIGDHFLKKGEDVDLMWCSSDPGSLDGIVLRERNTAIVDGTSPHTVDPEYPGAAGEILDFGQFWDRRALRANREEIIKINEKTGACFRRAYGFLQCAGCQYGFMSRIVEERVKDERIQEMKTLISTRLSGISALRRHESRMKRDVILGKSAPRGEVRKYFAGAITPAGIRSGLDSLAEKAENMIILEAPAGFRPEKLLAPVSERCRDAGLDTEEYYCPMDPENRLEHVVIPKLKTIISTENRYHSIGNDRGARIFRVSGEKMIDDMGEDISLIRQLEEDSAEYIARAAEALKEAKASHDVLEKYYMESMDFEKLEKLRDKIIGMIEDDII